MGLNIGGIDEHRTGLPCRGAIDCGAVFRVPDHCTLEVLLLVGRDRDAHELAVHGAVHIAEPIAHSYQSGFSKRGHSLLGRKAHA